MSPDDIHLIYQKALAAIEEHTKPSKETKEFMEQTNTVLMLLNQKMEALIKQVEDGFSGVHARQDKTNGTVASSKQWIDENKQCVAEIPELRKQIVSVRITVGIITGIGIIINIMLPYVLSFFKNSG